MEMSFLNVLFVFGAGLASVLSPCVLPILPIVVTGTESDHRLRPIFIVSGLSLSFIAMGIVSSAFGSLIAGKIQYFEKAAGVIVLTFGILMLFGVNLFKGAGFFNRFRVQSRGMIGGFILGMTLGIVWVPCVGPMLSSVLAAVATKGNALTGVSMLGIYSLGFAVPMLAAGYATQFFRGRTRAFRENPVWVRWVSGGVLVVFGLYILLHGMSL